MKEFLQKTYITNSEEETFTLAQNFAKTLSAGHILCLRGELGVGKTVFAKGLCSALGVTDYVSSPTFTLVNEYEGAAFPIYHFDLYRIEEADELLAIGFEEFISGHALVLVEWPQRAEELLPAGAIDIWIERQGEDSRRIVFKEREK